MQKSEVKPILSIMKWLRLNLLRTFTLVFEPLSSLLIAFIMDNSSTTRVFFLIWFFAATFSFCKVNSNISCNEKEKQALLNLKRGLTDPWNALSSWSDQEDCCKWAGVHCDNKTARVRKLQLGNLNLNGEISPSLLELEHLNYLDLSISNFNCTPIPSFLSSMGSMRHLNLASAGFCGLIPHQLGNLSDLRYLNLGYNFGLYVHNLRWMSSLSSMKYLDMSYVNLSSALDWLQIMSRLSSLSELYLQGCHLDSLNPSLGFVNFTSLLVLDLSVNLFFHEIPNWFSNISSTIIELDLSSNALKGEIPCSVSNFQNLEHLVLGLLGLVIQQLLRKEQEPDGDTPVGKAEDESNTSRFYIGLGIGFALGFWGVCGALFFKRTWRHAYFRFVYDMKDQAYVTTVLKQKASILQSGPPEGFMEF
nr:putative inactive leucine-rich repeat receptor-like protein kinase [Quercus suber]